MNISFKKAAVYCLWLLVCSTACVSCNDVVYSQHSKSEKSFARPSLAFLEAIVKYRTDYYVWPGSLQAFALSSPANKKIVDQFQYNNADFKTADSNNLKIIFYSFRMDRNPVPSDKIDLNALNGEVRFFKKQDRFAWKVTMH